jgi:hypothetical protein
MTAAWGNGAHHDRTGHGEADRKLVRDGGLLDLRDKIRREQRGEDVGEHGRQMTSTGCASSQGSTWLKRLEMACVSLPQTAGTEWP